MRPAQQGTARLSPVTLPRPCRVVRQLYANDVITFSAGGLYQYADNIEFAAGNALLATSPGGRVTSFGSSRGHSGP